MAPLLPHALCPRNDPPSQPRLATSLGAPASHGGAPEPRGRRSPHPPRQTTSPSEAASWTPLCTEQGLPRGTPRRAGPPPPGPPGQYRPDHPLGPCAHGTVPRGTVRSTPAGPHRGPSSPARRLLLLRPRACCTTPRGQSLGPRRVAEPRPEHATGPPGAETSNGGRPPQAGHPPDDLHPGPDPRLQDGLLSLR